MSLKSISNKSDALRQKVIKFITAGLKPQLFREDFDRVVDSGVTEQCGTLVKVGVWGPYFSANQVYRLSPKIPLTA